MAREWRIAGADPLSESLARQVRVSRVTAQLLLNRGVRDADAARRFLSPTLSDLFPPEAVPGVPEAARHIAAAVRDQRRIVLYGDYDVDGITGVAILWNCLRLAGATVDCYVPHRLEEGYGLNTAAIEKLAADGAQLIVTVDCGITAIEPARRARELGVELIVTDHHSIATDDHGAPCLPEAAALVHPRLGGSPANADLSGAGVAFKLAWAIAQEWSGAKRVRQDFRDFLLTATGLAALGTVADVVSLTGENRVLAMHGLRGLPASQNVGVRAIIAAAGLTGQSLSGYDVGFKLGPRLNAIGRMGHARLAIDLFTRADADEARRIAENLEQHNRARQTLERRITAEARDMVIEQGLGGDASRAIVLAKEGWHAGVIGIVAARLVSEFHRPTVLISLDNGHGQGSGRSVPHFPLDEALRECRQHLVAFGGHAMAAGLRIERDQCAAFAEAFGRRAAQRLTPADLTPALRIDAVAALPELQEGLVNDLNRMEPFGAGNPEPLFATDWLDLCYEPRTVGANRDHLQFVLGGGGLQRRAIAFNGARHHDALRDHRRCRVAFRPILNEWNGRRTVEMQVVDFQFAG